MIQALILIGWPIKVMIAAAVFLLLWQIYEVRKICLLRREIKQLRKANNPKNL